MNDRIDSQIYSLSHTTVDDVVRMMAGLGKGAFLAKVNIKSVYWLIPVYPDDRLLLAMQWNGRVFVDATCTCMLPFGCAQHPKSLQDWLEWIIRQWSVQMVEHYLDDIIVLRPPTDPTCQWGLNVLMSTCNESGVPLAGHKL